MKKTIKETSTVQGNSFPIEVFPKVVRNYIEEAHNMAGMSKNYLGLSTLVAAATGIGNTHKVEEIITVSPIIYAALVGSSSTGKSPAIKLALEKIKEKDNDLYSQYERELDEYKQNLKIWKSLSTEEKRDFEFKKPELKQINVDKSSPEFLLETLKINRKSLLLNKDELIGMIKDFKKSQEEDMLKIWDNDTIKYNTKSSGHIHINNAFLNVIGGIQPSRLKELAKNNRNDSGFIFRFLFAYPDEIISHASSEISTSSKENFNDVISRLLELKQNINSNNVAFRTLKLTTIASEIYQTWRKEFIKNHEGSHDEVQSIIRKLENYSLRFCLILQILYWAANEEKKDKIHERAVEGAIKLTEYFKYTALKVQQELNPLKLMSNGKEIIELKNQGHSYTKIESLLGVSSKTIAEAIKLNRKNLMGSNPV